MDGSRRPACELKYRLGFTGTWTTDKTSNNYTLQLFDYPLWWVSSTWDHVYYTGNLSFIELYYANMKYLLDNYYPAHTSSSTSLLVRPEDGGDYAFIARPGSAAYYSALYVLALNRAADLANLLSYTSDAARWQQQASMVAQSFPQQLWDPSVGAFFDRRCSGSGCRAHAQDGNSLAILSGITPGNSSNASSILSYLKSANARPYGNTFYDSAGGALGTGFSERVYPFISYFEIAARFEAGQAASALDQLRRMYGWMASHDPYITHWEGIGADGTPYEQGYTSMAHGWSTGVVPLLSNYILGIKPTQPGFAEWSVRPSLGDLTWAQGLVPLPGGAGLYVQWSLNDDGDVNLCVSAPSGTRGMVGVRDSEVRGRTVTVNEEEIWDGKGGLFEGAVLNGGFVEIGVEGTEQSC